MILQNISLVDWGMGAALIGIFAVVCIVLVLVVLNLMNSDKKKEEKPKSDLESED